jgi:hypothetical protein
VRSETRPLSSGIRRREPSMRLDARTATIQSSVRPSELTVTMPRRADATPG